MKKQSILIILFQAILITSSFSQNIESQDSLQSRLFLCSDHWTGSMLQESPCGIFGLAPFGPGIVKSFNYTLKSDIPGGKYKYLLCISLENETAYADLEIRLIHTSNPEGKENIIAKETALIDSTKSHFLVPLYGQDPDTKDDDILTLEVEFKSNTGSANLMWGYFPLKEKSDSGIQISHLEVPWKIEK